MWYVVQVIKGREDAMARLISRVVGSDVLQECFCPRYATEMKVRGSWVPCERMLFPGYLIAVTDKPEELERHLVALPEFARVLSMGEKFGPLAAEEVDLIGGFTKPGQRCVPMSKGHIEEFEDGDRIVVTRGPLKSHEAMITRVNRRKSVAYLCINFCGRPVETRVGLGLLQRVPREGKRPAYSDLARPVAATA